MTYAAELVIKHAASPADPDARWDLQGSLRWQAKPGGILEPAHASVSLWCQPAGQAVVLHPQQAACHALLLVLTAAQLEPWL